MQTTIVCTTLEKEPLNIMDTINNPSEADKTNADKSGGSKGPNEIRVVVSEKTPRTITLKPLAATFAGLGLMTLGALLGLGGNALLSSRRQKKSVEVEAAPAMSHSS